MINTNEVVECLLTCVAKLASSMITDIDNLNFEMASLTPDKERMFYLSGRVEVLNAHKKIIEDMFEQYKLITGYKATS